MKIVRNLPDSIDFEFDNDIIIGFWQCLTEVIKWREYNWNTWQFINIEFENDIMCGAYEFTFVFLCCGFRVRIPNKTKKSEKLFEDIDKEFGEEKEEYNEGLQGFPQEHI